MLVGTETGITVTYQDTTGDINFVLDTPTDNNFTTTLKNKLDIKLFETIEKENGKFKSILAQH